MDKRLKMEKVGKSGKFEERVEKWKKKSRFRAFATRAKKVFFS